MQVDLDITDVDSLQTRVFYTLKKLSLYNARARFPVNIFDKRFGLDSIKFHWKMSLNELTGD